MGDDIKFLAADALIQDDFPLAYMCSWHPLATISSCMGVS
jgi:hypothetical protein